MKIFRIQTLAQFAVSALLSSLVIWSLPASATILSVLPSTQNVTLGQAFSVDISISGVSDLYAFQFDLGFDPSIFSGDSITEGTFLSSDGSTFGLLGTIDNSKGDISGIADSLESIVPGVSGTGILASINFTALATGPGNISLSNVILLNSSLTDINIDNFQNANIVVNENSVPTSPVPEPTTFILLATGLISLAFFYRKRLNNS